MQGGLQYHNHLKIFPNHKTLEIVVSVVSTVTDHSMYQVGKGKLEM